MQALLMGDLCFDRRDGSVANAAAHLAPPAGLCRHPRLRNSVIRISPTARFCGYIFYSFSRKNTSTMRGRVPFNLDFFFFFFGFRWCCHLQMVIGLQLPTERSDWEKSAALQSSVDPFRRELMKECINCLVFLPFVILFYLSLVIVSSNSVIA